MGKNGLLNVMRNVVTSAMSSTVYNRVRCVDRAWLSKATDIVGGKRGKIK